MLFDPIPNSSLLSISVFYLAVLISIIYFIESSKSRQRLAQQNAYIQAALLADNSPQASKIPPHYQDINYLNTLAPVSATKIDPMTIDEQPLLLTAPPKLLMIEETTAPELVYPSYPGCEKNGSAALELQKKFPKLPRLDIVRFLVARKGNVSQAAEMIEKNLVWRQNNLPVKKSLIESCLKTGVFFPKGEARDGTPILYFIWAHYDTTVAPAESGSLHLVFLYIIDSCVSLCSCCDAHHRAHRRAGAKER
jgi:hypothetical protein